MTFKAENIINQIEQMKTINKNPKAQETYDWILSNGESFVGRTLTKEEETELRTALTSPLYKPKHCFYNSQMIVMANNGFEYYEGYAQTTKFGINFEHGWLVRNGKVFDPTWKDGAEYFGVRIPKPFIRKRIFSTGEAQSLFMSYIISKLDGEDSSSENNKTNGR